MIKACAVRAVANKRGGMAKRNPGGVSVREPAGRGAAEHAREDIRQGGGRAGGIGKEPEILLRLRTCLGLQREGTQAGCQNFPP